MERRTLLLLGGAAVATIGAVIGVSSDWTGGALPAPGGGSLAFPDLAARLAGAAPLTVVKHDATLTVARRGEAWVLPDRGDYPVRAEKIRELLVGLTELRLVEARTTDADQLGRLGVDDPMRPGSTALLLRVQDAGGATLAELVVGRRRVRTQGNVPESVYVRRPGEAQAWLAEGRIPLDADPQLWVDRDIVNIAQDRVRRVVVRRVATQEVVLARPTAGEGPLRILSPPDPPSSDPVSLDEVARAFEYLTFLDVKRDAEMPGEALGEARFELAEGLAVRVWPSRDAETLWIRLRAEGGEDAARWNQRWQGWAYQVGVWKEKAFVPRLEDLLEREAVPAPAPAR